MQHHHIKNRLNIDSFMNSFADDAAWSNEMLDPLNILNLFIIYRFTLHTLLGFDIYTSNGSILTNENIPH